MPIKASYADAFYRACANDYFCDSGSFWDCHAEYHAHLAELAANKTKAEEEAAAKLKLELEAEKKKTKAEEEEAAKLKLELEAEKKNKDKGLPAWAIALIVVLSLLGTPVPSSPLAKPRCPAAPPCRAALPIPLPLCGRPALLHPLPGARRQGEAGQADVRHHGGRQGRPDEQGVGRTGRARQEGPDQPKMLPEATLLVLGA